MKWIIPFVALAFVACSESGNNKDVISEYNAEGKTAIIVTTAKDTEFRLTQTGQSQFKKVEQPRETDNSIFVNPNNTFQTFIGIGGAITDASAEVFAKLSEEKQEELLSAYYGEDGIDYTLMRTSIHSSDFGSGSFTYIEEGDKDLKTFSIDHDRQFRLPMIKQAIEKAGGSMLFYVSPWSPPAFMKGKENMLGGGKLLPDFYESWAMYYAKTINSE